MQEYFSSVKIWIINMQLVRYALIILSNTILFYILPTVIQHFNTCKCAQLIKLIYSIIHDSLLKDSIPERLILLCQLVSHVFVCPTTVFSSSRLGGKWCCMHIFTCMYNLSIWLYCSPHSVYQADSFSLLIIASLKQVHVYLPVPCFPITLLLSSVKVLLFLYVAKMVCIFAV